MGEASAGSASGVSRPKFPIQAAFWIAFLAQAAPILAERLIGAHSFLDRGDPSKNDLDLLALPIHVISFSVDGAAPATLALLAGLIAIWAIARRAFMRGHGGTLRNLILLEIVAGSMLALSPVTLNPDPTSYILFGRLYGVFGLNPYLPPQQLPFDPILRSVVRFWGPSVPGDCYGPLWTLLVGGVAHLQAHLPLAAQWITQRLLAVGADVAMALGLFRILCRGMEEEAALSRLAAFAFHPFVLLETAVNGHNDVLMLAPAVWAFALLEEMPTIAGLLLGMSIAVKFVSVIAVPFFALSLWRARRSSLALLKAATAAAAAFLLPFAPFWGGWRTLNGLLAQGDGTISPAVQLHALLPSLNAVGIAHALLALWSIAALVLIVRFFRNDSRYDGYLALTLFVWASPLVGAYYFMWLSPILVEEGRWGGYVRRLLAIGVVYYVLGLFPLLPLLHAASLYLVIALLWPILPQIFRLYKNQTLRKVNM